MKKLTKKLIFIYLLLTLSSPIIANPFFSTSAAPGPAEKTIVPVLTGPTNPEIAHAQGSLREKIASFFKSWKQAEGSEKNAIFWGIILTSFVYGIIHAAGPGHRKTIVFSLYIVRKSPWYEPLITGLILAFLHGGSAIAIMFIFKGVSGSISKNTNALSIYMEGFSYGIIIILAVFMIIKETIDFIKNKKNNPEINANLENASPKNLIPFLISGLYPCPGAILILVLSFTLNILWAGITAVIAMSLGMAILIIFVAYMAWFGRKGLFLSLKNKKKIILKVSFGIEMAGYIFLLFFSLYVSLPFFTSLIK